VTVENQTAADDKTAVRCCGERPVGVAGQPLVLSCQLCPKSPTYWRTTTTEGEQQCS